MPKWRFRRCGRQRPPLAHGRSFASGAKKGDQRISAVRQARTGTGLAPAGARPPKWISSFHACRQRPITAPQCMASPLCEATIELGGLGWSPSVSHGSHLEAPPFGMRAAKVVRCQDSRSSCASTRLLWVGVGSMRSWPRRAPKQPPRSQMSASGVSGRARLAQRALSA